MRFLAIFLLVARLSLAVDATPVAMSGCAPSTARMGAPRALAAGHADVWLVDMADASLRIPVAMSGLERDRAAVMQRADRRQDFEKSRGAMRAILAQYLGVAPDAVEFGLSERHKPFIAKPAGTGLTFNISHSGGKLAVMVARDREVGVDIEKHKEGRNWEGLSERSFSEGERRYLATQPEARAYKIWTLKEAVLKAQGTGIDRDLTTFSVLDAQGRPAFSGNVGGNFTPHFAETLDGAFAGFDLAVVSAGKAPLELRFWEWK